MDAKLGFQGVRRAVFAEVRRVWAGVTPRRRNSGGRPMVERLDPRVLLTAVTATAAGSGEVDLAITPSAGAVTMEIDRSTDNITFTPIYYMGSPLTSYPDTGLSPNTTYYYEVSDFDGSSNQLDSQSASATTGPSAPSFSVASSGSTALALSSISCDGSATAMQVYTATSPFTSFTKVYDGAVTSSVNISSSITSNTAYEVEMTDSTSAGTSDFTSPTSVTTAPAAPTFAVAAASDTSVQVSTISCPSSATAMQIDASYDNSTWFNVYSGAKSSSQTISSLPADTLLYFPHER